MHQEASTPRIQFIHILRTFIKGALFFTLVTPLIIGPFSYSFSDYPQVVFFRTITTFAIIAYLILLLIEKDRALYIPPRTPLTLSILAFLLVVILGTIFSMNPHRSFWGSLEHVFGLSTYVYYFIYFVLLITFFKQTHDWIWYLRVTFFVSFLSSCVALLQKFGFIYLYNVDGGAFRVSGTLSNPDYFSVYLVVALGLGAVLIIVERALFLRLFWSIAFFLNFLMLIFSGSRASWMGFFAGIIVFIIPFLYIRLFKTPAFRKNTLLLVFGLSIIGLIGSLLMSYHPVVKKDRFVVRLQAMFDPIHFVTDNPRWNVWEIAWTGFKERPILGWGTLSFGYLFEHFMKHEYFKNMPTNIIFYHPHNSMLEVMSNWGILGIISYMAIFISAFILLKKKGVNHISLLLIALMFAYFVQELSLFDTPSAFLLFIITLALIHFVTYSENNIKNENKKHVPNEFLLPIGWVTTVALIIGSIFVWYEANAKPMVATQFFLKGLKLEHTNFDESVKLYKKGVSFGTFYDTELRYAFLNRAISALEEQNSTVEKKVLIEEIKQWVSVLEEYAKVPDISPITPYQLAIKSYEQLYFYYRSDEYLNNMERLAEIAHEKFGERPRFFSMLARAKIYTGKQEEGEKLLKTAFEYGNKTQIRDIAQYHKELGLSYYIVGDVKKILEHFHKEIEYLALDRRVNPNPKTEPQATYNTALYYQNVASLFYTQGDYEGFKDVVSKLIFVFPEHKRLFEDLGKNATSTEKIQSDYKQKD